MTTREDERLSTAADGSVPASLDALSAAAEGSLKSQDEARRELELDALADMIMSRRLPAPKTLVGLGVPQAKPSVPGEMAPEPNESLGFAATQQQPAAVLEPEAKGEEPPAPMDLHALWEQPVSPNDLRATREDPLPPVDLGATQEHAFQPIEPLHAIAPPPPDGADAIELPTLPSTRRYRIAPHPPRRDSQRPPAPIEASPESDPVPRSATAYSDAPWAIPAAGRKEPALGSRLALIALAFAASLAATLALVNSLLPSRKGNLLVTASGPNQVRIEHAEVLLDGKTVCAQVPCRLEGLPAGTHAVNVWAKGYERMAPQAINVRGGADSALQLTLARKNTAALRVSVNVPGMVVRLDGEERGTAPTTIHQLSPTEHTLRLAGNAWYAPFEQRVTLEADRVTSIEPKLVAVRNVVHLERGSGIEGARIDLIQGDEKREIKKLPTDIEIKPGSSYRVRASKRTFEDFDVTLGFDESQAERSIVVALTPREPKANAAMSELPMPALPPAALPRTPVPPPPAGSGIVNVNSIPISNVLVDGRPMGSTPQRLTLTPGQHSLTFVHPTLGRQERSVTVTAGQTAVAAVRF
ncbi:MAG: PEGA domain-containing protein [Myxococcota bacterium]